MPISIIYIYMVSKQARKQGKKEGRKEGRRAYNDDDTMNTMYDYYSHHLLLSPLLNRHEANSS